MASLRWAVRESQRRLVVIDRHWVSECIYARVYRGGTAVGADLRALHRVLLRYGALIVVCAPEPAMVVENHKRMKGARKEMYDDVEDVANRYWYLWHGSAHELAPEPDYAEQLTSTGGVAGRLNWSFYDFTMNAASKEIFKEEQDRLIEALYMAKSGTWFPYGSEDRIVDICGNLQKASIVLIGDKSGGERPNWPFCHNEGSSSFLNGTLHKLWADEEKIAIINAWGPRGYVGLLHLAEEGGATVVALGNRAMEACVQYGVIVDFKISHPQFARRFHFHGGYYADSLKRAIDTARAPAYLPIGGPSMAVGA
jgi:hypothetical protein